MATRDTTAKTRLPGCGACTTATIEDGPLLRENGHTGYQCVDCGLIYIAPRLNPAEIVNLYDHDSAQVSASQWINAYGSFGKALKAKLTLRFLRKYRSGGDLLEIGPGGGAFLKQARKYFSVHAAEFNPSQVEHIRNKGLDCRQGPFDEVFSGQQFDVIYLCDVLSHLFDPVDSFKTMHSMLTPGGIIMLETGNIGDVRRKYYRLFDQWQYPDHLFFFSRRSLPNLADAAGLKIVAIREYSRLWEMKLISPVQRRLKGGKAGGSGGGGRGGLKSKLKRWALSAKHTADYFMIYRLGALTPKHGRPQTVVVVLTADEQVLP